MAPSNNQELRRQLDLELGRLTRAIEQFRIDTQRYFGGDLNIPPEELKESIAGDLRRLRGLASKGGTAGRYRLSSLEARFNSQADLFNRRLREMETGGKRRTAAADQEADPMGEGVLMGQGARDNAVETLYKGLYLQSGSRNPSMDLEKFRSYLNQQTETIRKKTGAESVKFRIAMEDGKMKLKAKPVKG
ncbi:MAG: hypothetical protein MPN21_00585 [Thermoanaerobaculia bacterium]|nr:hypothetical protein [Thermoanaerobaculia bacterium]